MLALVMTPNEVQLNWQWPIVPAPVNYETISDDVPSVENTAKICELSCTMRHSEQADRITRQLLSCGDFTGSGR
ncbi:hypothetical protein [Nocardia sp. CA-290969]|uniref:hypothetical protein n=1 Tax=Nocardia sp. CA-290969 TaxID=3239986 RepID=UPI003D8E38CC